MYKYKIKHNSINHDIVSSQPLLFNCKSIYQDITTSSGGMLARNIKGYYLHCNNPCLVEPLGTFIFIDLQNKLKIVARKTKKISKTILFVKEFDVILKEVKYGR